MHEARPGRRRGERRITVIGDLVEDVVVWVGGATRPGTDNPAAIHRGRGGSGANVAAAIAAAGGVARFVGRVGNDDAGRGLERELALHGVDVRVQREGRTGTVVVIVAADGERTMFPDRGAAGELVGIDPTWLDATAVLHVPAYGFSMAPSADALLSAARRVHDDGGAVSVDASATSVLEALGPARFAELLAGLRPELVFANEEEATTLAGAGWGPPPGCLLVVKQGPAPARLVDATGVIEVPALAVADVRDTTGAGDAFAGGFLAAWVRDHDPVDACVAGHVSAARVLQLPGAGPRPSR